MLLQIFLQNFYSNASCFSLLWLYLGNSQVSVYRTIGPTLVTIYGYGGHLGHVTSIILIYFHFHVFKGLNGQVVSEKSKS